MILSNFHTHTNFCDGLSTPQEYIGAALAAGLQALGFSSHGYVPYEGLYSGMPLDAAHEYRRVIGGLKNVYSGQIEIYTGLENDAVNLHPADDYDYTIGSVHCIKCGDIYYSVDSRDEIAARAINDEFSGDGIAYALAYFDTVYEFAAVKRADILGHIDLVRRFNTHTGNSNPNSGGYRYFDEGDPRYRCAAVAALERAARSGYIIEVSTAPLSKGFSGEAYPALFLLKRAKEIGARIMVNSDAHSAENLTYAFGRVEHILKGIGFKERWELAPSGFVPVAL